MFFKLVYVMVAFSKPQSKLQSSVYFDILCIQSSLSMLCTVGAFGMPILRMTNEVLRKFPFHYLPFPFSSPFV